MSDELILVDIYDNEIGAADKAAAHCRPLLHRAFSVFLYDDTENHARILLQKRALSKYHSAGLWANTCCSHPRRGEDLCAAAAQRLAEEMGISSPPLQEISAFVYYHQFHDSLYEYEFDHVLVGRYNGSYQVNPAEAAEAAWVAEDILAQDLSANPRLYAPWFLIAAPLVLQWLIHNKKHSS